MSSFMRDLMDEFINYGGMAATRAEVFHDVQEICTHNAVVKFGMMSNDARKAGEKAADWFAFFSPPLTQDEVLIRLRFVPRS